MHNSIQFVKINNFLSTTNLKKCGLIFNKNLNPKFGVFKDEIFFTKDRNSSNPVTSMQNPNLGHEFEF